MFFRILVGILAAFAFLAVASAQGTTITQTVLTSSQNPYAYNGIKPVTLTATVSPGAATGTVSFMENGTVLTGGANVSLNNGVATFQSTTLPVGTHYYSAVYSGDPTYAASSGSLDQVVTQGATQITTFTSSLNPAGFGQPVTFTASLNVSAATGSVEFFDGTVLLGSGAVSGGTASFTASSLAINTPPATHTITAVYGGDANFAGCTTTSNLAPAVKAIAQAISKDTTTTTVSTSPSGSSVYGMPLTFTATVTNPGTTPSGTITFKNGTTTLGSGVLVPSGPTTATASFTTSTLAPANYANVTAVYSGDIDSVLSTSPAISLNVVQSIGTVALAASDQPSYTINYGQSVTFTATVVPQVPGFFGTLGGATPTGTITFTATDNSTTPPTVTTLGTSKLNGSAVATLATTALPIGTPIQVTASYGGDANYAGGSGGLGQIVNANALGLTATPNPTTFGVGVTFTATVTPPSATGPVSFVDSTTNTTLGSANLNSSGVASFKTSAAALAVGSHTITAVYAKGNASSAPLTQVVNLGVTATKVVSSGSPTPYGSPVTFTATVTNPGGTPTGTVTFMDGTTPLGTGTLSGGVASFPATGLAGGNHSITAIYAPDSAGAASCAGSTSAALTQTMSADGTGITLASSIPSSVYGQQVTFTAVVANTVAGGATPTGTVTFYDGAATLGSGTLDPTGTAIWPTAKALGVGLHNITATYAGVADFAKVTSGVLVQTVNQGATGTSLALTAGSNPSLAAQSVSFTATVTATAPAAGVPTGTVTFSDGGAPIGTVTLPSSGLAVFATTGLTVNTPPASHTITASYSGDINFTGSSTPSALNQTVDQPLATTTDLMANPNPGTLGQPVTITATVTAPASITVKPFGTVTFLDGTTVLGTGTLDTTGPQAYSIATFTSSTLAAGTHKLTASYPKNTPFTASTSPTLSLVVLQTTSTTLASSANPSSFNQPVTFTAAVTPSTATGTVTFVDNGTTPPTTLGSSSLSGGSASLKIATLDLSTNITHAITASYGGSPACAPSSASLTQQVNTEPTSVTLSANQATPYPFGKPITFTATVASTSAGGTTPTGSVQFMVDAIAVGAPVTLSAGKATTVANLAPGVHAITASYSGDVDFAPVAASQPYSQTISTEVTTTKLSASANPSVFNQSVTFTANVTAATGTPTGSVSFYDNGVLLGSSPLVGNNATFAISTLAVGTHGNLTATYSSDTDNAASTSSAYSQVVNPGASTAALALTTGATPASYGQQLVFTATVNAALASATPPTGQVNFMNGTTLLGTGQLGAVTQSGATATFTSSTLPVASYSVTAVYQGDGNYKGVTSSALAQKVALDTTTITLAGGSPNPSASGQPVTFTASVNTNASGLPTGGSVLFMDNKTTIGTGVVDGNGNAAFTTAELALSSKTVTHAITAQLVATSTYAAVTSAAVTQTVTSQAGSSTQLALTTGSNPSSYGQPLTFTATVTPAPNAPDSDGELVLFKDGSDIIGQGTVTNGIASFTTSSLDLTIAPAPVHLITAVYGGDYALSGSTSNSLKQSVNQGPTTTTLNATPNPSSLGQVVTLTASVQATYGTPQAYSTVTFMDGTTALGSATLTGGQASFTTATLAAGTHSLTAVYAGDIHLSGSTSSATSLPVSGLTITSFTATPSAVAYGGSATLNGVFSGGTGTVYLLGGASPVAVGPLTAMGLQVGPLQATSVYQLTVTDTFNNTLNSQPVTITVLPGGQFNDSANDFLLGDRTGHTATLLPNGQGILLAGGVDANGNLVGTAEIHAMGDTGVVTTLNLKVPRTGHTATLLANGTVLLAGGQGLVNGQLQTLNSAEILNPAGPGGPGSGGTVPTTGSGGVSPAPGGGGGTVPSGGGGPTPGGGTLTLASYRTGHTATLLWDGTVFIAGGTDQNGNVLNTAEILAPSGVDSPVPQTMLFPRSGHTATLLPDGSVFLAGGLGGTLTNGLIQAQNTAELYVPAFPASIAPEAKTGRAPGFFALQASFKAKGGSSTMTTSRTGAAAVLVQGAPALAGWSPQVLLVGGSTDSSNATALASVESFNYATRTFSSGGFAPLQTGRYQPTANVLFDGRILVVGGLASAGAAIPVSVTGQSYDPAAEIYDPAVGQFQPSGSTMDYPRSGHTATLTPGNTLFIAGGIPPAGTPATPPQPGGATDPGLQVELFSPQDPAGFTPPDPPNVVLDNVQASIPQNVQADLAINLVAPQPQETYVWYLQNASLDPGGTLGTSQLLYDYDNPNLAPPNPRLNLVAANVLVTSVFGIPSQGSAVSTLVNPVQPFTFTGTDSTDGISFSSGNNVNMTGGAVCSASIVPPGNQEAGVSYTWTVTNGTPAPTPGNGTGLSFAFTAGPATSDPASNIMTVVCTAADAIGNSQSATLTVSLLDDASPFTFNVLDSTDGTEVPNTVVPQPYPISAGASCTASIPQSLQQSGVSYTWAVTNGTPASGTGPSFTFTASTDPNASTLTLVCTGTDPLNNSTTASFTAVLEQPGVATNLPSLTAFGAQISNPEPFGGSFDLTWQVSGATGLTLNVIDPNTLAVLSSNILDPASNVFYVQGLFANTTYQLAASNGAGTIYSLPLTVTLGKPPASPQIQGFRASNDGGGMFDFQAVMFDANGFLTGTLFQLPSGPALSPALASGVDQTYGPFPQILGTVGFQLTTSSSMGTTSANAIAEAFTATAATSLAQSSFQAPGRAHHTATVLPAATGQANRGISPDALVFLAGGGQFDPTLTNFQTQADPTFSSFLGTTDLYDPIADAIMSGPVMAAPRAGHSATLLPDGTVLLAGGLTFSAGNPMPNLQTTAELYDPNATSGGSQPNGAIAILPTLASPPPPPTGSSYGLNTGRFGHTATRLDISTPAHPSGAVLIAGGQDINGNPLGAELYDIATQTFAARTPNQNPSVPVPGNDLAISRYGHTATRLAQAYPNYPLGVVLIAGGTGSSGSALQTAEIYDPNADEFVPVSNPMTVARSGHSATRLPSGQVLLADATLSGQGQAILDPAEIYDPGSDPSGATPGNGTFTATGILGEARSHSFGLLMPTGQALVAGGDAAGNGNPSAKAELYAPATGFFSTDAALQVSIDSVTGTGNCLPDGRAMFTGGLDQNNNPTTIQFFDPLATANPLLTPPMLNGQPIPIVGNKADPTYIVTALPSFDGVNPAGSYPVAGTQYQWSITGGNFPTPGRGGVVALNPSAQTSVPQITFVPLDGSSLTITCQVTRFGTSSNTTSLPITVGPAIPAVQFQADNTLLAPGQSFNLSWTVIDAQSASLLFPDGSSRDLTHDLSDSASVAAPQTPGSYTYTLNASNAVAPVSATVTIQVASNAFAIQSFTASPTALTSVPGNVFLSWSTTDTSNVTITDNFGNVLVQNGPSVDTTVVSPLVTTTYTLTAYSGTLPPLTQSLTVPVSYPNPTVAPTIQSFTVTGSGGVVTLNAIITDDSGNPALPGTVTILLPGPPPTPPNPNTFPITSGVPLNFPGTLQNTIGFTLVASNSVGASAPYNTIAAVTSPIQGATTLDSRSLLVGRAYHTATLLTQGNALQGEVLLAGGGLLSSAATPGQTDSSITGSTDIYDPVHDLIGQGPAMAYPRTGHSATRLQDGTVLLAGGITGTPGQPTSLQTQAELYTPGNPGTITLLPNLMPSGRYGQIATFIPSNPGATHWPSGGQWPNGLVLFAGGLDLQGNPQGAQWYDPATQLFQLPQGAMISNRSGNTATLLNDGTVLVTGGTGANSTILNSAELYNPATDSFQAVPALMNAARTGHSATLLPTGQVLLADQASPGGSATFDQGEIYDPVAQTFTPVDTMAQPTANAFGILLPTQMVLVAGGANNGSDTTLTELFNPFTGFFNTDAALQFPVDSATATITGLPDGRVLFTGGLDGNGNPDKVLQLFDPLANATPVPIGPPSVIGNQTDGSGNPVYTVTATPNLGGNYPATGFSYSWSITGGSFAGGVPQIQTTQPTVGFIPGDGMAAPVTLTCTTTRFGAASQPGTAIIPVAGYAPSIANFSANPATVNAGQQTSLSWAIGDGPATQVLLNGVDVTQQSSATVTPPPIPGTFTYTLTAYNHNGSSSATVTITVTPALAAPSGLSYSANPAVFTQNVPITPDSPTVTGTVTSYQATLPAGLSIDGTSGIITGTPTIPGTGQYMVTASDGTAAYSTTASLTITVQSAAGPATPVVALPALVTSGKTNQTSTQDQGAGMTYFWTLTNGTILSGQGTTTLTYAAGAAGSTFTAAVQVTDLASRTASGSASATVVAAANAELVVPLSAHPGDSWMQASVPAQASVTFQWSVTNGTVATGQNTDLIGIDAGTSGMTVTADLQNQLGDPATGTRTISVQTGTWLVENGGLPTTWISATATLLPSGRVLYAGGTNADGPMNNASIYDPVANTFTATASMQDARVHHTATLLPDGQVLVTGGAGAGGLVASTEIYDPATGLWTVTASALGQDREQHTATLMPPSLPDYPQGAVMVVGGQTANNVKSTVEVYAPALGNGTWETGTWQTLTNTLNETRQEHTATLMPDGSVLVAGGVDPFGSLVPDAEILTGLGNPWTILNVPAGLPRYRHTANLVNGSALIAGGNDGTGNPLATAYVYTPGQGWSQTGSLNTPRYSHTANLLPNGKVLAAGGATAGTAFASAETFDPATGLWTTVASMSASRASHTATLRADGQLMVAGGVSGDYLASSECYDSANNTWTATRPGLGAGRTGHTLTLLANGTVLAVGGVDANNITLGAQLYDPATGSWSDTSAMVNNRSYHAAVLLPASSRYASGAVLVVGGADASRGFTPSADLYDVAGGTWVALGSLNETRGYNIASLLPASSTYPQGAVLVAGGTGVDASEIYDLSQAAPGTWNDNHPNLHTPRQFATANTLPDGTVLVAGGEDASSHLAPYAEVYNPATDTWTTGSAPSGLYRMNTPRRTHTATLIPNGGAVLVVGGEDAAYTPLASVESYNFTTHLWTPAQSLQTSARYGHTAVLLPVSQKVMVVGGLLIGQAPLTSAEVYDPVNNVWSATGSLVTGSYNAIAVPLNAAADTVILPFGSNADDITQIWVGP